jgi:hypothetical protein
VADPVSWLMIEPGWRVVAADGSEVGRVSEVIGDSGEDIFNGLAVATSAVARPRYVPAERADQIVEGEVRLSLSREEFDALEEYQRPPTSARVHPSDGSLGDRIEATARSVPLFDRLLAWLGLRGKR